MKLEKKYRSVIEYDIPSFYSDSLLGKILGSIGDYKLVAGFPNNLDNN